MDIKTLSLHDLHIAKDYAVKKLDKAMYYVRTGENKIEQVYPYGSDGYKKWYYIVDKLEKEIHSRIEGLYDIQTE